MHSSELYSIGEFSKMCHVSVKTLWHYDSIGLLPSYKKNPETNYRYYTYDQMYQLFFIQNMKNFDFSLKEIQEMLGQNDRRRLIRKLEGRIDEFSKKITRMEMQRDFLSSFLERIKSGDSLMEARTSSDQEDLSLMVERIPVSNVIFLHQHKTNYINHEINFAARRDLVQIAKKNSLLPSGPFTATYHNPPLEQFFSDTCDYEISAPIIGNSDASICKQSGGYTALTSVYVGGYEDIIKAHIKMLRWIKENHYHVSGDISETFLITPIDTGSEGNYVTKITIPIERESV